MELCLFWIRCVFEEMSVARFKVEALVFILTSWWKFLLAFTTGQEEHSKPESSVAKLYCLHLQEQECKRARALLLTSLGARAQERKSARERMAETPSPFKENYSLPRTHHSLIGCSPWPSKGRVHVVENYSWHMRRLFVYHLEHRMSAPSCDGECGGGSQHLPLSF